jgi:hypothetical protein
MLMTRGAVEVFETGRREERSARVMMVVGLPMLGEPSPGILANVNDEDDQRDRPRRWWSRSLGLG